MEGEEVMAWTPLADTREEGWRHPQADPIPDETTRTLGPPLPGLSPGDWMIVGKVFERKSAKQIAEECKMTAVNVRRIMGTPQFKRAIEMVEASIVERIARGEFGVLAIAKANAVGAMRRLVGIAKGSEDDRVKLNANLELLKLSGVQAPKPAVTESPERLIDQMTADEAEMFAREGIFPDRFKDQLARLASSALEKSENARWEPHVEVMPAMEGENSKLAEELKREKPREVVEED